MWQDTYLRTVRMVHLKHSDGTPVRFGAAASLIGLTRRSETMKIQEIISQSRRDFTAEYICEACGHSERGYGYDDDNFHRNVIPKMACKSCGATSSSDYRPLATKYSADQVV